MAENLSSVHRNNFYRLVLLSFIITVLTGGTAHGQRSEETARQMIRLRAYGLFSYVDPDYYGSTRDTGATIGGDIDGFRLVPHTDIGLDARYKFARGPVTNQYYYGGGPRLSVDLGRFKPYADLLFAHGKGVFNNSGTSNYTEDVTSAITYGGGLDLQVNRSWAIRADLQRERWRFSIHQPYFYPVAASVGVSYQFHFHSRTGPNW